jgi:hypothetical protein
MIALTTSREREGPPQSVATTVWPTSHEPTAIAFAMKQKALDTRVAYVKNPNHRKSIQQTGKEPAADSTRRLKQEAEAI